MRVEKGKVFLTESEYRNMDDESIGVCLDCGETRGECEPDAEKYECESCGAESVFGMEELMMMGKVTLVEDPVKD